MGVFFPIGSGGGGGSYINGTVPTPNDLPITTGTPAVDSVYMCKAAYGVWFLNRKPAGLYCRTANFGALTDWTYLGAFPEINSDANWRLFNDTTTSKQLAFDLSGITASTTRTLTVPNASGTIALAGNKPAFRVIRNGLPLLTGSKYVEWFVESDTTGAWPINLSRSITSIVKMTSGEGDDLETFAYVTLPAHKLSEGDNVTISGVDDAGYNGTVAIHNVTPDTFLYTVANDVDNPVPVDGETIRVSVDGYKIFVVPSGMGGLWAFHASIYFGTDNGNSVTNEVSLRVNGDRTAGNYVSSFTGGGGQGQNQVFSFLNVTEGDVVSVFSGFFYNATAVVRSDDGVGWFAGVKL
jgi:hypothetical protein